MQKILYLHAGAEMYGADKVLLELIKGLDKDAFEAHVILPNDGVLVDALKKVGAKVKVIDYPILRRKYFNPKGILEYFGSYNRYSKQIATSGYNPKRLQYQLQELKMVDNLLSDWNLDSSGFDKTIKSRILMSNIYNISKQNTQVSIKLKYVKDICENKAIKSFIYTEENDLKPFIKYLLKHKMYRTVLFLKKVQALIKRS